MKKNFLFSLLAVLLAGFWFGGVSLADDAEINWTNYPTIQDAIDAAIGGDTVQLKQDVTLTSALTLTENKSIIFDMAGYTLTGSTRVFTITSWTLTITWDWKMGLQNDWDLIYVNGWNCVIENWSFKWWTVIYAYWASSYVRINWWSFDGTSVWNRTAIHATYNAVMDIYWWDFVATVTGEGEGNNKNLKVIYAWWDNNRCDNADAWNALIWWTVNVYSWSFYGRLSKSNKWTYNIQWWIFRPTEIAWINCDYEEDGATCVGWHPNSNWCYYWTMDDIVAAGYVAEPTGNSGEFEVVLWTICRASSKACISNSWYSTIQDAIDAAIGGDTVQLKQDVTLTSALTLTENKSIIFDMAGYTLTGSTRVFTITSWTLTITWDWKMGLQNDWDLIYVNGWNCVIENWSFKWWTVIYAYWASSYVRINWWSFDGTSVWNRTAIHATYNAVMDIYWWDFVATVTGEGEGNNKNLKVIYAWWDNNRCDNADAWNALIWWTVNVYSWSFYGRLSKSNKWTYNIQWWIFRPTEIAWINCDYEEDGATCVGWHPNSNWCYYWTMDDIVAAGYVAEDIGNWEFEVKQQHTVTFDWTWAVDVADWAKVAKPSPDPSKSCYTFSGWYNGDVLYDFDLAVTSNLALTSQWKDYSCWWSSSSSSSSSGKTSWTTKVTEDKTTTDADKTEEDKTEETNDETPNQEEDLPPLASQEELQNPEDQDWYDKSGDQQEVLEDGLTREMHNAYEFAVRAWITTMKSAEEANMYGPLNRIAMAKMLVNYAINVLWMKPDTTKQVPNFWDVSEQLNKDYWDAVTLAYQLWIMWIGITEFRPFDEVPRWEFGTALSRMLFGLADGQWDEAFYEPHLQKLKETWIITNDNPDLEEVRGYVMIMLMRSANKKA